MDISLLHNRWQRERKTHTHTETTQRGRKKYDGQWSKCVAIHSLSLSPSSSCHYSVGGNDDKTNTITSSSSPCALHSIHKIYIEKEFNATPIAVVVLLKCTVRSYSSAIRQLIVHTHTLRSFSSQELNCSFERHVSFDWYIR